MKKGTKVRYKGEVQRGGTKGRYKRGGTKGGGKKGRG